MWNYLWEMFSGKSECMRKTKQHHNIFVNYDNSDGGKHSHNNEMIWHLDIVHI